MILGITGCPGSGKSLLAHAIEQRGWELVDADLLGRDVVETSAALLDRLAAAFGPDIIESGRLNRGELARRAFKDAETVRRLNGIVHPVLVDELRARLAGLRERGVNTVVDCALIFEWNIEAEFEYVVTVTAEETERIRRIRERDGRPDSVITGIMAAQLPEAEKVRRADIVLKNDRGIDRIETFGRMLAALPDL